MLSIRFMGSSEVVDNFGNWFPRIRMPLVVGQLVVFDDGAVLILSFGRLLAIIKQSQEGFGGRI